MILSVENNYFPFRKYKQMDDHEAVDENMNAVTLAGETSPPKSTDKRFVSVIRSYVSSSQERRIEFLRTCMEKFVEQILFFRDIEF